MQWKHFSQLPANTPPNHGMFSKIATLNDILFDMFLAVLKDFPTYEPADASGSSPKKCQHIINLLLRWDKSD